MAMKLLQRVCLATLAVAVKRLTDSISQAKLLLVLSSTVCSRFIAFLVNDQISALNPCDWFVPCALVPCEFVPCAARHRDDQDLYLKRF